MEVFPGGTPGYCDVTDVGSRRSLAEQREKEIQMAPLPLGVDVYGSIRTIRHISVEIQAPGFSLREIPESHPLHVSVQNDLTRDLLPHPLSPLSRVLP